MIEGASFRLFFLEGYVLLLFTAPCVGKHFVTVMLVAFHSNARWGGVFELFEFGNGGAHVVEQHIGHVATETLSNDDAHYHHFFYILRH